MLVRSREECACSVMCVCVCVCLAACTWCSVLNPQLPQETRGGIYLSCGSVDAHSQLQGDSTVQYSFIFLNLLKSEGRSKGWYF